MKPLVDQNPVAKFFRRLWFFRDRGLITNLRREWRHWKQKREMIRSLRRFR